MLRFLHRVNGARPPRTDGRTGQWVIERWLRASLPVMVLWALVERFNVLWLKPAFGLVKLTIFTKCMAQRQDDALGFEPSTHNGWSEVVQPQKWQQLPVGGKMRRWGRGMKAVVFIVRYKTKTMYTTMRIVFNNFNNSIRENCSEVTRYSHCRWQRV